MHHNEVSILGFGSELGPCQDWELARLAALEVLRLQLLLPTTLLERMWRSRAQRSNSRLLYTLVPRPAFLPHTQVAIPRLFRRS